MADRQKILSTDSYSLMEEETVDERDTRKAWIRVKQSSSEEAENRGKYRYRVNLFDLELLLIDTICISYTYLLS